MAKTKKKLSKADRELRDLQRTIKQDVRGVPQQIVSRFRPVRNAKDGSFAGYEKCQPVSLEVDAVYSPTRVRTTSGDMYIKHPTMGWV